MKRAPMLPIATAALLATTLATTACRGAPESRPDAPVAQAPPAPTRVRAPAPPVPASSPSPTDESWPEAAAAADAYLAAHVLAPDLARVSTVELRRRLTAKTEALQRVAKRLAPFAAHSDPETAEAAAYRAGVLYLNLACELVALEAPTGLTGEQASLYRALLAEQAAPLVKKARPAFARSGSQGAAVLEALGPEGAPELEGACRDTRDHWYHGSPSAVQDLESRCREGVAEACLSAARTWEEPLPLLERACELGHAPGCRATGQAQVEDGGLDAAVRSFTRGCELDDAEACLLAAAVVDPSRAAADAEACGGGDAFACLRRAQRLAGSRAALVVRCDAGQALPGLRPEDARRRCELGVFEACLSRAAMLLGEAPPETGAGGLVAVYGTADMVEAQAAPGFDQLRQGCARGYEASCQALARLFRDGERVALSPACAAAWAFQACDVSRPSACGRIGEVLRPPSPRDVGRPPQ